jgi:hypothetical protein
VLGFRASRVSGGPPKSCAGTRMQASCVNPCGVWGVERPV